MVYGYDGRYFFQIYPEFDQLYLSLFLLLGDNDSWVDEAEKFINLKNYNFNEMLKIKSSYYSYFDRKVVLNIFFLAKQFLWSFFALIVVVFNEIDFCLWAKAFKRRYWVLRPLFLLTDFPEGV